MFARLSITSYVATRKYYLELSQDICTSCLPPKLDRSLKLLLGFSENDYLGCIPIPDLSSSDHHPFSPFPHFQASSLTWLVWDHLFPTRKALEREKRVGGAPDGEIDSQLGKTIIFQTSPFSPASSLSPPPHV